MQPRSHHLPVLGPHGFHRLHVLEWGSREAARTAVCVHGLTRCARDFDTLAAELATAGWRVLCVDVAGRGGSDWLTVDDYHYGLYVQDLATVLTWSGAAGVDWIGTSMGGLIGLLLAARPGTPIVRLVLNDIGPFVPKPALERIAAYVGQPLDWPDLASYEQHLRTVAAPFGPLDDAQWQHLARHSARQRDDGRWVVHYDPAIGDALRRIPPADVDLWPVWEQVRCPVLVLRGAESDVLTADTAAAMQQRGPRAECVVWPGIGHAPALLAAEQTATVLTWLQRA